MLPNWLNYNSLPISIIWLLVVIAKKLEKYKTLNAIWNQVARRPAPHLLIMQIYKRILQQAQNKYLLQEFFQACRNFDGRYMYYHLNS